MTTTPEETSTNGCLDGVCNPERTHGLISSPDSGDHTLISLQGPGVFLAAEVVKQGGDSDLTFVNFDIDGRNVTSVSFAAAENTGLTQQNPFGLVLLTTAELKSLTIGFPVPLRYGRELKLAVRVSETGVVQILANVIHGSL